MNNKSPKEKKSQEQIPEEVQIQRARETKGETGQGQKGEATQTKKGKARRTTQKASNCIFLILCRQKSRKQGQKNHGERTR